MKIKNKIINIVFIITFLFLVITPADVFALSTGNIYLSPLNNSLIISNQLDLSLRINPGTTINSVQATINFDPHYLTFVSSSNNNSTFSSCLSDTKTASSVSITCAILGGSISSDSLIKTLVFNTITTGSTTLSITNSLSANNGVSYYPVNGSSNVSITNQPAPIIQQAPTSHPTTPTQTYTPQSSPNTTTTNANPVATVKISPINLNPKTSISNLFSLKAIISIKTTQMAIFYVKYGVSKNNLSSTSSQTSSSNNTTIALMNLNPKTVYFYQVYAVDSNNITQNFPIESFTTKGVSLTVQLLSSNFQPIKNTKIYLNNISNYQISNTNGQVTFYNQSPGNQTIFFFKNNQKFTKVIFLPSQINQFSLLPQNQTIIMTNLKLASNLSKPALAANITVIALILSYAGFLVFKFKTKA